MTKLKGGPKTKRIRIAVAIAANGEYNALGWGLYPNGDHAHERDVLADIEWDRDEPTVIHWIEADVPIPEFPEGTTIEGSAPPRNSTSR